MVRRLTGALSVSAPSAAAGFLAGRRGQRAVRGDVSSVGHRHSYRESEDPVWDCGEGGTAQATPG